MKRVKCAICAIMMILVLSACAGSPPNDSAVSASGQEEISGETEEVTLTASLENGSDGIQEQEEKGGAVVMDGLILSIGDKKITVEWENNESVDALKDLAGSGMQIKMSMYGGFEQVGSGHIQGWERLRDLMKRNLKIRSETVTLRSA